MDPFKRNRIAHTNMLIPQLGFGGGTLGDPNEVISEFQSLETLGAAYGAGITFYDTAPWYGNGKSEHRLGTFLRNQPRESFMLNTKVGKFYTRPKDVETFHQERWLGGFQFELNFDYTTEGFERAYRESLLRLSMTRVDSLVIHDLDNKFHPEEGGVEKRFRELVDGGGFEFLKALKDRGEIKAIGVGVNFAELMPQFIEYCDIDFFLVAMPYTLLDQPALEISLPLCEKNGISVISGAVFASGILATGVGNNPLYGYEPAEESVIKRVRSMERICQRFEVPLGAVALQFPLGHPVVKSVIPGMNSPEIVEENLNWFKIDIPTDLWNEFKEDGLLNKETPVPTLD